MKCDVCKEIREQLKLQRQPLVQDEGDSIIVNLFPSPFRMIVVEGGTAVSSGVVAGTTTLGIAMCCF